MDWLCNHVSERMYMYLSVCTFIWAYVHVSERMYMYLGVCTCIWAYVHVSERMYMHLSVCTCTWAFVHVSERMYMYLSVCTWIWAYVHVSERMYMYLSVCTCISAYVHVSERMYMYLSGAHQEKAGCSATWQTAPSINQIWQQINPLNDDCLTFKAIHATICKPRKRMYTSSFVWYLLGSDNRRPLLHCYLNRDRLPFQAKSAFWDNTKKGNNIQWLFIYPYISETA